MPAHNEGKKNKKRIGSEEYSKTLSHSSLSLSRNAEDNYKKSHQRFALYATPRPQICPESLYTLRSSQSPPDSFSSLFLSPPPPSILFIYLFCLVSKFILKFDSFLRSHIRLPAALLSLAGSDLSMVPQNAIFF